MPIQIELKSYNHRRGNPDYSFICTNANGISIEVFVSILNIPTNAPLPYFVYCRFDSNAPQPFYDKRSFFKCKSATFPEVKMFVMDLLNTIRF